MLFGSFFASKNLLELKKFGANFVTQILLNKHVFPEKCLWEQTNFEPKNYKEFDQKIFKGQQEFLGQKIFQAKKLLGQKTMFGPK